MTSDLWLVRLVGVTVCSCALIIVLSIAVAAFREADIPELMDRLGFLLAGGLLTALTTRLTGDKMQVTANPHDPLPVVEAGEGRSLGV